MTGKVRKSQSAVCELENHKGWWCNSKSLKEPGPPLSKGRRRQMFHFRQREQICPSCVFFFSSGVFRGLADAHLHGTEPSFFTCSNLGLHEGENPSRHSQKQCFTRDAGIP